MSLAPPQESNYNFTFMLTWIVYFFTFVFFISGCGSSLTKSISLFQPITIEDEIRISRDFRREANKKLRLIRQPEVEGYINRVGRRILSIMGPQPYEYRFFVVENPQLNAFAVPGGSIYLHTGLIERIHNTDELAGVLGHEIIHVKLRHMARLSGPDPVRLIGLLGVLLTAAGSQAGAVGILGQAIATTRQLSYTRAVEQEADNLGVRYMDAAGYDPRGALRFLNIINKEKVLNPVSVPPYLLTHPLTQDRIGSMEVMIRSLGLRPPRQRGLDPIKRVQLFLRLELEEGKDPTDKKKEKLASQSPKDAQHLHFRGLRYYHKTMWDKAREAYEKVRLIEPRSPGLDRDLGRLYTQTGEFHRAHAAFKRSIDTDSREPLNYFYLGELFEKEAQFAEAAGSYLRAHKLSPFWYEPVRRLSLLYGKMNRSGDAYYYLARSHLLQDQDEKALNALKQALKIYGASSLRGQMIQDEMEAITARN